MLRIGTDQVEGDTRCVRYSYVSKENDLLVLPSFGNASTRTIALSPKISGRDSSSRTDAPAGQSYAWHG